MKRKRMIGISLVIGLLLIGLIVALAINYSRSQPVVEQKEFTELKVSATATAEAGTEYLFETPSVKYGDEELDVTVTVQYGDKLIPHDGKKYYIEETGEYTITYAAYADGKSTAATTKLTAVDGIGPVIVSKLPQYIRCNTNIELTESFVPKDISGGKIDSYSVVDITNGKEKNLKSGQFDGKSYTLRITDSRVKSVRVKISASDSAGIINTRDVDVKVISNKYGVYTMESKAVYKTVSASIYGESVDVLEKKEDGYAVFKATIPKQYPKFMIQSEELKDLANFDYITVRYKVSYSSSSGNVGIKGIKGDVYNKPSSLVTDNGWTVATWRKDEAYNDIGKNVFDYIRENGIFELSINAWASADAVTTITLAEISGGYDDIISDGRTAVNLINKLNLSEKEFTATFTPEGGVKQAVGNVKAFVPKTAGQLAIHVNKEGYLPGQLALNVLSAPAYGVYKMEHKAMYNTVSATSGSEGFVVKEITDGDTKALQASFTGTYLKYTFSADYLKDLANFDYITLKYKITYSENTGSVGLKGTAGDVYNRATSVTTEDGWTIATWRKDDTHNNIGEDVFSYIKEKGIVEISVFAWHGKDTKTTITVAEVTGGYDGLVSDGGKTTYNLVDKIGLPVNEYSAAFTPEGGKEINIGNRKAFTPYTAGQITVKVNKQGYCLSQFVINVREAFQYGTYATASKDDFKAVSASIYGAPIEVKEVTENGTPALQAVMKKEWPKFCIQSEQLKDLSKFDYFTIKYKLSGNVASLGLQGMQGSTYNRAVDTVTDNDGWTYATWRKDNQKAINNSISDPQGADVFDYIEKNGSIEICLYVGADVTLTVAEITGGYDKLTSDGKTTYNLVDQIGLSADKFTAKFTPTGGAVQTVTNVKAFTPTSGGVLTLDIQEDGYQRTQCKINIREAFKYGTYVTASKDDFKTVSASIYGTPIEVKEVTENGTPALQAVMKKEWPKFCIQSEQLKDLSKFDYFTIKYKLSGNVASLGLQGMQGSTYNTAVDTMTDNDGWIYATWRKDNQKAINNSISDPQGADVFDYIEKNGSLEICLYVGADVTLTVAEITGGYDDIVSDGTAIDLTKELALEEEEFTATFTPTGGAAQNVTNKSAFQPTERGVLTLEIDKQGYGLTQTAVNVKKSLQYGIYPTNKKSDFASVSATNGTAALEVEEVTEGEYAALKVVMSKQYPKLTFKSEELKALAQFDYFTVRYKVTYSTSSGNLGITGTGTNLSYFNTASTEVTEDGWTIGTWRKDETNYNNKGQKIFEYIETNGILEFSINAWNGDTTTTTLIVAEIIGGYDDLMSDCESPIDLTIQYGLAADEFTATFTPTGGTAQNVVDETAFVPTGNGTLTLDIKKAGYWQTSVSVNVKKAFAYGVYPTNKKSDFTSVSASVYGTPIEVSEITEGEYPAFRTVMTKQYPKLTLQSEALKDLASFDYFTIRYKISYSASGGNLGIKGTTGDVYNRATSTITDDGWTVATWRKDDTYNNIGKNVFDYIKNNGILELCINAWNGADTTTTLTVAEIIGGYDDVTYSGTAIDLTSKFGLVAGEFTATFTPTGESAQAVSDVTAFVPSKNGVLTLNVDKAGCCKTKLEINVTVPTNLSLLLRRVVNKFLIG